ncbi:hypothetical protein CHS0354_009926 [Potamilus streckersoni]|uniref:Uncharacterized protein n=1 Tax=Potamilus streckersoni TaxID=2493646 RepID=A0AAE0TD34_9BIVA|nr:hypothetical protein CHS0354_009926 [Potamilus streckersoni]
MENRVFDSFRIQATAEKLKAEYQIKTQQLYALRTELSHLKDRADCYKNELTMKENICIEKVKQLQGKLLQLRKDLETCTSKLNSLPVEESQEHRCLKCLREQWNGFLKQTKCCDGQTEPNIQSLYSTLLDLDFDHVQNCRLKEEMENNLNQGMTSKHGSVNVADRLRLVRTLLCGGC